MIGTVHLLRSLMWSDSRGLERVARWQSGQGLGSDGQTARADSRHGVVLCQFLYICRRVHEPHETCVRFVSAATGSVFCWTSPTQIDASRIMPSRPGRHFHMSAHLNYHHLPLSQCNVWSQATLPRKPVYRIEGPPRTARRWYTLPTHNGAHLY